MGGFAAALSEQAAARSWASMVRVADVPRPPGLAALRGKLCSKSVARHVMHGYMAQRCNISQGFTSILSASFVLQPVKNPEVVEGDPEFDGRVIIYVIKGENTASSTSSMRVEAATGI